MHSTKKILLALYCIIFLPTQLHAMEAKDIDEDCDKTSISAQLYLQQQVQHFMEKAHYLTDDKGEVEQLLKEHISEYTWNIALRGCYALQEFNEVPFAKNKRKEVILFILGKSYLHTIDKNVFDKVYKRAKSYKKPILLDTLRNCYDTFPQDQHVYATLMEKGLRKVITSKDIFKTTFLIEESIAEFELPEKFYKSIYMRDEFPLIRASYEGNTVLVKSLLKRNIDATVRDQYYERTAFIAAAQQGHKDIVVMLDAHLSLLDLHEPGWMSLMLAAKNGHSEIVEFLISRGFDINMKTRRGWTPLMTAAYYGQIEMVKRLLAQGAKISLKNKDNETACDLAKEKKHFDIARLLT